MVTVAPSKQLVLFFVGPDMCGKTQIARELSRVTGVPYFKASSEHQTYLQESNMFLQQLRYADPRLADFLAQTGHGAIMDRGFPCEFAYSRVMGRDTDEMMLRRMDQLYADLGARVVVCYRQSYAGIVDDLDERIDSATLERLELAYRRFAEWTKCKILFLPVDGEDLQRQINLIQAWIDGHDIDVSSDVFGPRIVMKQIMTKKDDVLRQSRCYGCLSGNCSFTQCDCPCHIKEAYGK